MTGSSGKQWQCQLASAGERLAFLKETGFLSDLSITFPGQQRVIQCHRWLLAMSSPVFEAMLCGPLAEGEVLRLPEDPPEAFEWILDHLYKDNNYFPNVNVAVQVYQLATKYQLDVLCEICSEYLIRQVDAENFPLIYDTAVLLEDKALLNKCTEVLTVSADNIFTSPEIGILRRSSLRHLLRHQDVAPSSEILVFKALLKWAEKKLETGESLLSKEAATPEQPLSTTQEEMARQYPQQAQRGDIRRSIPASCSSSRGHSLKGEEPPMKVNKTSVTKGHAQKPLSQDSSSSSLRNQIEEFLPHVRFLSMTTDEFVQEVLPSGLLTNEESVSILMNIKSVPNIPLPSIMVSQDKTKRKNKVKTTSLMFCQHHFARNDQEILRDFRVSKPIYVTKITAPAVMSTQDTDVTVLASSPFSRILLKGLWRGTSCKFDQPVKLIPGEEYSVIVGLAYGSCSGCECTVSSNLEELNITGKTLGLSPVYLNFWEED